MVGRARWPAGTDWRPAPHRLCPYHNLSGSGRRQLQYWMLSTALIHQGGGQDPGVQRVLGARSLYRHGQARRSRAVWPAAQPATLGHAPAGQGRYAAVAAFLAAMLPRLHRSPPVLAPGCVGCAAARGCPSFESHLCTARLRSRQSRCIASCFARQLRPHSTQCRRGSRPLAAGPRSTCQTTIPCFQQCSCTWCPSVTMMGAYQLLGQHGVPSPTAAPALPLSPST